MKRVALMLAAGFEEIEALTPVDVLRRAGMVCDMIGLTSEEVTGSHGITVKADKLFDGDLSSYDMIVLPGGMPGSVHLRDDERLISALKQQAKEGSYIAAICAAPIVLEQAGLLEGRRYTCFPGQEESISSGKHQSAILVLDDKIVTSKGAGTSLAFAYQLVSLLGGDAEELSEKMVYKQLFQQGEVVEK